MSKQAENFKGLVKGNSISSIITALKMLKPSVRQELMTESGVSAIDELAIVSYNNYGCT